MLQYVVAVTATVFLGCYCSSSFHACMYLTHTVFVVIAVAVAVASTIASNDDYKTAIIAFSKAVKFEIDSKLVIIG